MIKLALNLPADHRQTQAALDRMRKALNVELTRQLDTIQKPEFDKITAGRSASGTSAMMAIEWAEARGLMWTLCRAPEGGYAVTIDPALAMSPPTTPSVSSDAYVTRVAKAEPRGFLPVSKPQRRTI